MKRPVPALKKGFWKAESKKVSLRFAEFNGSQAWLDEPAGVISGSITVIVKPSADTLSSERRVFVRRHRSNRLVAASPRLKTNKLPPSSKI